MKRGDVIGWMVVDLKTGEPVMWCASREQARKEAGRDGRIARVVVQ